MKYEVLNYEGIGYQEIMRFQSWKIAILNYIDELKLENLMYVEKHLKTDEAFVLLKGEATLIFAEEKNNELKNFEILKLVPNKIYNVKKDIYHTHILSPDCQLLIIEEADTDHLNSKRIMLTKEHIKIIGAKL